MCQLFRETKIADDDNDGFTVMVVRDGTFLLSYQINSNEHEEESLPSRLGDHGSLFAPVSLFVLNFIPSLV